MTAVVAVGVTVGVMYAVMPLCYDEQPTPAPSTPAPEADPLRPHYHYTPHFGWVNDPNGLFYYKGEWHLFYQHDYESIQHGNMSWGHAVSTDLVHWSELPVAISYDDKEQIFSGSVVVDTDCKSGLCAAPGQPVLVAFYTSYAQQANEKGQHIQSQHISTSSDLGRTWTKYSGNPVLDIGNPEFRDPQVQRWQDGWLMLVQRAMDHTLEFYHSKDLKDWGKAVGTFGPTGHTGGVWECPDIFQLPVDGDVNNKKWVLIVNINPGNRIAGSAGQFWVGTFDGTTFTPDGDTEWLDWGMDNYATITWNNDGERVAIGWMSNWNYTEIAPASTFRNAFTVPRTLQLRTIDGKLRLTQLPVPQLTTLRRGPVIAGDKLTVTKDKKLTNSATVDLEAVFTNKDAQEFGVVVFGGSDQQTLIGYDAVNKQVFVDRSISGKVDFHDKFPGRHSAPYEVADGASLKLRVLVDHGSVEAFFGEGEIAITDVVFPDYTKDAVSFYTTKGSVVVDSYSLWRMGNFRQ